jgi:hypothetical protein
VRARGGRCKNPVCGVMADERQESPRADEPSSEGAPPGGDPDYHLHSEIGEEAKRLVTHPREEAHRLAEELQEGETETTPFLLIGGVALAVSLIVVVVIVLVFVVARLAD